MAIQKTRTCLDLHRIGALFQLPYLISIAYNSLKSESSKVAMIPPLAILCVLVRENSMLRGKTKKLSPLLSKFSYVLPLISLAGNAILSRSSSENKPSSPLQNIIEASWIIGAAVATASRLQFLKKLVT